MARIRSIKPEFFESEDVSALPFRARLTWIGLWVHCDNYGRHKDNVKLVKKNVWPLDQVSLADVEEDLSILADHGRIVRYEVDGRGYLAVVNWDRHQSIARPGAPRFPAPPTGVANVARHSAGRPVDSPVDSVPANTSESGQGHGSVSSLHSNDTSLGNRDQGTGNREGTRARAPAPSTPTAPPNPAAPARMPASPPMLSKLRSGNKNGTHRSAGSTVVSQPTTVRAASARRRERHEPPTPRSSPPGAPLVVGDHQETPRRT